MFGNGDIVEWVSSSRAIHVIIHVHQVVENCIEGTMLRYDGYPEKIGTFDVGWGVSAFSKIGHKPHLENREEEFINSIDKLESCLKKEM